MPATAKYDITLSGDGYILMQESYRKQIQTPYVARFSTGDPSAGDLSFWQHIFQDQFNGGNGQNRFEVKNKFFRSHGMTTDPLRREMYQSFYPTNIATFTVSGHTNTNGYLRKAKAVVLDSVSMLGIPSSVDWVDTFTVINTSPTADNVTDKKELVTVPSLCVEFFSRDISSTAGRKGFMVGLHNSVSFRELPALAETVEYSTGLNANGTITAACQCTLDVFAFGYFRPDAADGGNIHFVKFQNDTMSSTAWTMNIPIGNHCPMRMVLDQFGHLWVLMSERAAATFSSATSLWVDTGVGSAKSNSSFLYRYNAASLDNDPYVDLIIPLPGYVFKDMEILGDSIYLFGEKIGEPNSSVTNLAYPVVYKVGFGEVFRGYATTADMQCSYTFNTGSKILFAFKEDNIVDTSLQPITIYSLHPGDIIETEAQFDVDNASTVFPIGVFSHANNIYLITNDTEASSTEGVYRFDTATRYVSGNLVDDKYFISSIYTVDSPLIDKYIADVTVKLTGAINTTNQEMQVYIYTNEGTLTSLGSFTNGNTSQAFSTASGTTARVFRVVLRSKALVDAQQFGIESIDIRFVPVPLKKYQWSLGIRLDLNQKLYDGSNDATALSTRLTNLQNYYRNNASIAFVDIDGTSYTCMVTDLIIRAPLIREVSSKQQYICFLELLEI